jgi:hypothetical protein
MCDYTFFYVVGGKDLYYEQLKLSLQSLKRINKKYKVKILDIGRKMTSYDNVEVIYIDKNITEAHVFWQHKYYLCQMLDTKYGIYLDCDTIICYDKLEELFLQLNESIGVIPHFHIQNFNHVLKYFNNEKVQEYCINNQHKPNDCFYTGGVFMFSNNKICKSFLKDVYDLHDNIYGKTGAYINGLTDETFISTILRKYSHIKLNGSNNHCSANMMPLTLYNDILIGKNPFDETYEPIFVLHGSSERQKQGKDYDGLLKEKITEMWNIL